MRDTDQKTKRGEAINSSKYKSSNYVPGEPVLIKNFEKNSIFDTNLLLSVN